MTAGHFASCLVKYFPRIHFSQQAMAMLIGSYACGYSAPRESGSKAPTQVAWHDFVHDVNAAPQLHPDDFVAIASRRQAEATKLLQYGQSL